MTRAFTLPAALLLTLLLLSGCAQRQDEQLLVFAAASLTDAFTEIGAAFEAVHPGTRVVFNFGGSSQLATQLREGAPAAVYASANPAQMQAVIDNGRIDAQTAVPFTTNSLVVAVPSANPAAISRLEDLARPGILLILAVPGVPVRQYTDALVAKLGPEFSADFYANVTSEEDNVRQVLAKVALDEADAGIVYTSDITPDLAAQVRRIDIPAPLNETASYPIAPLRDAPDPALAQAFLDFVRGPEGQAILVRWGFGPAS